MWLCGPGSWGQSACSVPDLEQAHLTPGRCLLQPHEAPWSSAEPPPLSSPHLCSNTGINRALTPSSPATA